MAQFRSRLFQGDMLLEAIAGLPDAPGQPRISQSQMRPPRRCGQHPAGLGRLTGRCAGGSAIDGPFGRKSARAVHRFNAEELLVEEHRIIDDVGPRTARRVDEIRAPAEANQTPPFVERSNLIMVPKGTALRLSDGGFSGVTAVLLDSRS